MTTLTPEKRMQGVGILCCHLIRNVAFYRTGHNRAKERGQFWLTVDGNFLDIAVLEWCKLFGDDNSEHSWKAVIAATDHASFQKSLLSAIGIDGDHLAQYRKEMRTYRDKFVAHLDKEREMQLPRFDLAIETVFFLYQYLRDRHTEWFKDLPHSMPEHYQTWVNVCDNIWAIYNQGEASQ